MTYDCDWEDNLYGCDSQSVIGLAVIHSIVSHERIGSGGLSDRAHYLSPPIIGGLLTAATNHSSPLIVGPSALWFIFRVVMAVGKSMQLLGSAIPKALYLLAFLGHMVFNSNLSGSKQREFFNRKLFWKTQNVSNAQQKEIMIKFQFFNNLFRVISSSNTLESF